MNSAVFARLVALILLAAGVAGCNDTQRPAPVYYGQQPGYAPPAYAQSGYSQPPAPRGSAPPVAPPAPVASAPSYLPPPTRVSPPPSLGGPPPQQIVIEHGETLYAVARRYQVPLRALIDANHLEPPYHLVAGRTLMLPQTVAALPPSEGAARPPTVATAPASPPVPEERPPSATPRTLAPEPAAPAPEAAAPPSSGEPPAPSRAPETAPPSAPPAASAPPAQHSETASLPPPPRAGRGFLWPVRGRIIAHFGTEPNGTHNDGIDISAPEGTPVLAAEAGVVAYAGNELRGYGNLVLIKHADGWMTAYGHNAMLLVKRGDRVQRGQVIAHVGSTGAVTEPQLHFELRKGTRALDPLDYMAPQAAER